MSRNFAALAVVLLAAAGCSDAHYTGKTYPATNHVDYFSRQSDIKVEHEVFGRVHELAEEFGGFDDVRSYMEHQAMDKGADALLIEGIKPEDPNASHSPTAMQSRFVTGIFIKYHK